MPDVRSSARALLKIDLLTMTGHVYEVLLQLSVVLGFLSVSTSTHVGLAQRAADLRDRSISTRSFSSLRRVVTSAREVSLSSDGL